MLIASCQNLIKSSKAFITMVKAIYIHKLSNYSKLLKNYKLFKNVTIKSHCNSLKHIILKNIQVVRYVYTFTFLLHTWLIKTLRLVFICTTSTYVAKIVKSTCAYHE